MALPSVIKPDAKLAVGMALGFFAVPVVLRMVKR